MASPRISGYVTIALSCVLLTVPAAVLLARSIKNAEVVQPALAPVVAALPLEAAKAEGFNASVVQNLARQLSTEPHRPRGSITPGLEKLGYDQYRDIHVRIDDAIWSDERVPFRLDLLPAGSVYTAPVVVSVVEDGVVRELAPEPGMFKLAPNFPAELRDQPLSISGFRVRARLNTPDYWDEFLVFQGASYFRAVGQGQLYGLSARGLALHTGEPQGEEFPAFTHFWIEKPARNAKSIVIHALLESPSVTGAYRYTVTPGRDTVMDVEYTLFPRVDLRNVGIAPLTSMFLFDSSDRGRIDDFRHRVHDSDGLMFVTQQDERVWRHLANPRALQLSSFTNDQPKAFGLMQRARLFAEFQDLEAKYERRPSAWVEFKDGAPPGPLRLVEIPTPSEANDNIVAYWQPRDVLPARQPYSGTYRLAWTAESLVPHSLGRFVATRTGMNMRGERRLVVLDLQGAGQSAEDMTLVVESSAGKIHNALMQPNPAGRGLRATFEFEPAGARSIEFRAQVHKGERVVSETWLYRWTAS